MAISGDTDDLLDTGLWGEAVTVVRNTPTYDNVGQPSDSWASVSTPNADIQPVSGVTVTKDGGQQREMSHRIFLPSGNGVRQGDRIRPSGWATGDNEYSVEQVSSDEGHVEVLAVLVRGHG